MTKAAETANREQSIHALRVMFAGGENRLAIKDQLVDAGLCAVYQIQEAAKAMRTPPTPDELAFWGWLIDTLGVLK